MSRRKRSIAAIPTVYKSIRMRSRLEVKWAAFMDSCGWKWSYEPLDLRGADGRGRIPDFLLHFRTPVLIESKPAVTLDEITTYRRELTATAMDWLLTDMDEEAAEDLRDRGDMSLWHRGRKALVVGSRLFDLQECFSLPPCHPPQDAYGIGTPVPPDGMTVDGWHYLTSCVGHVGLHNHRECLVCGLEGPGELRSHADVMAAWIAAGNAAQWKPPVIR